MPQGRLDMVRVSGAGAAALEPAWQADAAAREAGMTAAPEASADAQPRTAATGEDLAGADERRLVQASIEGSHDAFAVIVERHQRAVYRVCYRFVGNHEDASDLTQDVFVRAFRGLARFKAESSLATWLYRIAVNTALNRVSSRNHATEPIDPDHPAEPRDDPADVILRGQRASRLRAAIARLPRKQRATLLLRVYHELPHEEIARILGSSVGAAKANFCHALGSLRRLLGSEAPAGGGRVGRK